MSTLFSRPDYVPLAQRVRPTRLEEMVGQAHLLAEGSPLMRALKAKKIPSLLLWGPPGVGKTTLAFLLAQYLQRPFQQLSAIESGVKEVREALKYAGSHAGTILFIDEIHRFNKGQQDALLGAVEKGIITLIGATTENPSFEVVPALLSRMQVYTLYPLVLEEMQQLVKNALQKDELLKNKEVIVEEWDALYRLSGGDARKCLSLLEFCLADDHKSPLRITDEYVQQVAQQSVALYDKGGEQHYDIISAFIKSVRGSDPNAALYWMARMLEGGEDPLFIARRMIILASEDIGNLFFEGSYYDLGPRGYFDVKQLQLLDVLYATRSVTKTAERLGQTQPTVSTWQISTFSSCGARRTSASKTTRGTEQLPVINTRFPDRIASTARSAETTFE